MVHSSSCSSLLSRSVGFLSIWCEEEKGFDVEKVGKKRGWEECWCWRCKAWKSLRSNPSGRISGASLNRFGVRGPSSR